jgi:hypothetical protein
MSQQMQKTSIYHKFNAAAVNSDKLPIEQKRTFTVAVLDDGSPSQVWKRLKLILARLTFQGI